MIKIARMQISHTFFSSFSFFFGASVWRGALRKGPKLLGPKRRLPKTQLVTKMYSKKVFWGKIWTALYRKMLRWFAKELREKLERVPKVIIHVVAPKEYCSCMQRIRTVILLYDTRRKKVTRNMQMFRKKSFVTILIRLKCEGHVENSKDSNWASTESRALPSFPGVVRENISQKRMGSWFCLADNLAPWAASSPAHFCPPGLCSHVLTKPKKYCKAARVADRRVKIFSSTGFFSLLSETSKLPEEKRRKRKRIGKRIEKRK